MSSSTPLLVLFSILSGIWWYTSISNRYRRFPGPKPHLFVGHTLQVPTIKTWRYFEKLWHEYGSIVGLSLAGDEIIVLSDPADAEELLGRRSHNYSSRRPLVYAGKYLSNNKRMLLLSYGDNLKRQRAAFHQMLQPRVVGAYESMQDVESVKLLHDILTRPHETIRHCRRFASSLVFNLTYGARMTDDDRDLNEVWDVVEGFVRDTYPGAHLVDTFPVLDRLPDFLAPWRQEARNKHIHSTKLYSRLALEVKEKMDNGNISLECFVARLWDQKEKMKLDLEELSYVAGTAFEAGTDTTSGTVLWFIMAMIIYPDVLKKAQAELDRVLDENTIPSFSHMSDLPYCVAVTKEVFRWAPAAPGGFPHYSDADDEYKGYKIKKHTMVIPCVWNMHRNEEQYPNAYEFNPDRFMQGSSASPESLTEGHYVFGFGRRKCPGQYLATKSIWIGLTRLMWAFNMSPGTDEAGNPVLIHPDNCTSGMTTRPTEFPMLLKPRSLKHAQTIIAEWERDNAQ